jgi:hypothetical protein
MKESSVQDCDPQDCQIVCDFYLCGNLTGKLYRNASHTSEALKNEIRDVTASISADKLKHVCMDSFEEAMRV